MFNFKKPLALIGKDLLVHPVTDEGAKNVTAYLPGKHEVQFF